ncbi:hypothetical protein GF357_00455 [Candidatus Dojkabacteria bacterium]|nr:hypothetical protein [Candidatus Dojkabacteria bacterium]
MIKKLDLKRVIPVFLISIIGLVALVSTEISDSGQIVITAIIWKQLSFMVAGFLIYKIVSRLDYTYLKHIQVSLVLYLLVLLGLILTLFFGPVRHNARRWLVLAGIQIQPSEFAKLTIIILTLSLLSLRDKFNQWLLVFVSGLFALIYVILIYLQPHGSMALIIMALWAVSVFTVLPKQFQNMLAGVIFIISFVSGIILNQMSIIVLIVSAILSGLFAYLSKVNKYLLIVVLVIGAVMGLLFNRFSSEIFVFQHQRERIEAYLSNSSENEAELFNVNQSQIAIGSGKLWGKGFGFGTQSKLRFLPEHQTDFIFASYAEEFGLVGVVFLIGCYGVLIFNILNDGFEVADHFGAALVEILGFKIMLEVFINIGTNTGIIPATGIPLPLFSAGGSITLATFITLGMIQAVILKD